MAVCTLTLNPAFDIHCECEGFAAARENRAGLPHIDAGGKGINLSRALAALGVENRAIALLGDDGGDDFLRRLSAQGLYCEAITLHGRIRENITVHDGEAETRLSFPGFSVEESALESVEGLLENCPLGTIVTLTGSLPPGIGTKAAKDFLARLKERRFLLVVDCGSFTEADLLEIKPWVIKPNEEEVARFIGHEMPEEAEILDWAGRMQRGGVSNVIVSLGARGAYMASGTGRYHAIAPEITPVSTIGAGDSLLAGFIAAYLDGADAYGCLGLAVACGTAACLTEGTEPPKKRAIDKIKKQVKLR